MRIVQIWFLSLTKKVRVDDDDEAGVGKGGGVMGDKGGCSNFVEKRGGTMIGGGMRRGIFTDYNKQCLFIINQTIRLGSK